MPLWTNFKLNKNKLKKIIEVLDAEKAVGPDLILRKVLKGVKRTISKPLSFLLKKSLRKVIFPLSWTSALVLPFFKKADKNCAGNYRPISLLNLHRQIYGEMCIQIYVQLFYQ